MMRKIFRLNCKKHIEVFWASMCIILLFGTTARGQLIGSLSGVLVTNRYTVIGGIWIEAGNSLIIEPGTELYFENGNMFEVFGCLIAEGTETDSITFTVLDTTYNWAGIYFWSTTDTSRLRYCVLEYGGAWEIPYNCGGAIYCNNSDLIVENCTIRNSWAEAGGGIFCWQSSPIIEDCIIYGNSSEVGGGIGCGSSNPTIRNCMIFNNSVSINGGGIWINDDSYPIIQNCTISCNSSDAEGGGIYCNDSHPVIENCTIRDNFSDDCGGGLFNTSNNSYLNPIIDNCDITGNISTDNGGGIYSWICPITIRNSLVSENSSDGSGGGIYNEAHNYGSTIEKCTISGNRAAFYGGGIYCMHTGIVNTIVEGNSGVGGIYFYSPFLCSATYNDFHNNEGGSFTGFAPTGMGNIITVNANGDSCDEFYNIFLDPMFVSTSGVNAFHLEEDSPCIDAGDPEYPLDPDSTIADIGVYYFHHTVGVNEIVTLEIPAKFELYSPYPNPFNASTAISYKLQAVSKVNLTIYDVTGREVAKLVDGMKEGGSHQVFFDAKDLTSGVYFARLEAGEFRQTRKMLLIK